MPARSESTGGTTSPPEGSSGPYSWYVLSVLVLVYVFNFIDHQILSILNEDIKADLGLTDAHMGFLYGTAFAVFYAIFGIPLGRLADMWVRKSMIAIGLSVWSLMTALSGTARGFGALAAFRIGVGIGESSASPAAYSMLGDYFPPRLRATAVAIYSSGVYIGAGVGMLIGGQIVERWNRTFPEGAQAPFGLVGWQAAFFAVGIPGLLMALWVYSLREPVRGRSEGLAEPARHPAPFRALGRELAAVIPPCTVLMMASLAGMRGVLVNIVIAAACAGGAWLLTEAIGSPTQWIALGIGLYAFFSWVQALRFRDPATFAMIYTCPSLMFGMIGFGFCAFVTYGVGYWAAPYFLRAHGESTATVGTILGLTAMIAGWIGVTLGGVASDWLRSRRPLARVYCGLISALASMPVVLVLFTTESVTTAYVANFCFMITSSFWIGSAIALCNELVMPRMRGTVSATYLLVVTFVGLALGPFTMGQISTRLELGGMASADALPCCGGSAAMRSPSRSCCSRCAAWNAMKTAGSHGPARSVSRPDVRRAGRLSWPRQLEPGLGSDRRMRGACHASLNGTGFRWPIGPALPRMAKKFGKPANCTPKLVFGPCAHFSCSENPCLPTMSMRISSPVTARNPVA